MNLHKFTLFLSRLPQTATNEQVEQLLTPFGKVDKVKLKMIKNGKACAGYGFIELLEEETFNNILQSASNLKYKG